MEEEYEQRISELQSDLTDMRQRIQTAETSSRCSDRERQTLVSSLSDQNQRLTNELQAAGRREEELQNRLSELRNQVNDKRMSMQDHVLYLENLKEEVAFVTKRKNELEKKVDELVSERDNLNATLDETSDKIVMLERHAREQDCQIQGNQREMCELRTNNQVLSERLECLSRSYSSAACSHASQSSINVQMSLLNEMEMSTSGSDSERSLYHAKRPCSQIDEEIEDLDDAAAAAAAAAGAGGGEGGTSGASGGVGSQDSEMACINSLEYKQLKEEVLSAHQQLKMLCAQLRQNQQQTAVAQQQQQQSRQRMHQSSESLHAAGGAGSSETGDLVGELGGGSGGGTPISSTSCAASTAGSTSSSSSSDESDDYTLNSVRVGRLNQVVLELKGLLHGIMRRSATTAGNGNGSVSHSCSGLSMDESLLKMEVDLHRSTEHCEKLSLTLKQSEIDIKRKEEEINQQQSKLSVLEVELSAVKEERDQYKQDMADSDLAKDQLIKKAWEVRDAAVKRKNTCEIDLAKERIATMQINSQLLETIKQKVELSQQLDQWQGDMEQLLEEQMKERLQQGEQRRGGRVGSAAVLPGGSYSSSGSGRSSIAGSNEMGSGSGHSASGRASRLLSFFNRGQAS